MFCHIKDTVFNAMCAYNIDRGDFSMCSAVTSDYCTRPRVFPLLCVRTTCRARSIHSFLQLPEAYG
jgi:hypothetical protein